MIPMPCTTWRDQLALLVLLLTGCVVAPGGPEPVHGQEAALEAVWALYGSPQTAPSLLWVRPPDLDCYPDETGAFWGWMSANSNSAEPECVGGLTSLEARVSRMALRRDDLPLHETALVHEAYHLALHDLTGDADSWHEGPGWGRYVNQGYERGVVDDARDLLKLAGR